MKTRVMVAFSTLVAGSLLAQTSPATPEPAPATPAPAAITAPATSETKPAPAPPPTKKKTAAGKKATPAAAAKKSVAPATPLMPGPATVTSDRVNVRGQAKLTSERVAQLDAGASVTVLEEIILDKPVAGEPARWARISLPADTKVWLNTLFVDTAGNAVTARRLNLRSGPGENYSIVGLLEKGNQFTPAGAVKGDWMQIEAPKGAYAFVASEFLKQEAPATVPPPIVQPTAPEQTPPPVPTPVTPPEVISQPAPVTPPAAEATPATEPPIVAASLVPPLYKDVPPAVAPQADSAAHAVAREALRRTMADLAEGRGAEPVAEEPPPPRIVSHEGVVRTAWSVQAPTPYVLVNRTTGRTINYLYTTSTNLNLSNYKGLHIVVTGEEALDSRWKSTPVLTIQRIQVLE